MVLDHPSLDPFEPLVRDLFDSAFGDALRGLASVGLCPGDEWHTEASRMFRAACLPGFKTVHDAIGAIVLDLESQIVTIKRDEGMARSNRDPSATDLKALRLVLEDRQLVLRRFLDGMLWVLFWPRKWILRRLRIEGGIRRVDPNTIGPLLEVVAREHLKREETIQIICDLTTVAQLGDVIIGHWSPMHNIMKIAVAELKVGAQNKLLYERLHDSELSGRDTTISEISEELGPATGKQARRMARQLKRLENFDHVIATDKGVHPVSGQPFRMTKDTHVSKDYRDDLSALIQRAKREGSSALTLDRCLHLLAIARDNEPSTNEGLKMAHALYHIRCGHFCKMGRGESSEQQEITAIINGPKVIKLFDFDMRNSVALPPLLWYPRDVMIDALMGRIKIFAQFDHEKFFELASEYGLKMGFIQGKEADRIKKAKLSGQLIEYRNVRYVRGEDSLGRVGFFGARFFARVYLELIRPSDLFSMAKNLIEESGGDETG